MKHYGWLLFLVLFSTSPSFLLGQSQNIEDTTTYSNRYDESLSLRKVTYLPSVDNVNGIYARAVDGHLKDLIAKNHQWDFSETNMTGALVQPEELVGHPKKVTALNQYINSDGFFISDIRKDPKGLMIRLYLFSARSGDLVTEENRTLPQDNTQKVLNAISMMMASIINRIPYDGMVLSRTDQRVTLNLGGKDNLQVGQTLNAVKIIGAKKHP
ncbi:MAG: hypothetical protein AAF203_10175, partial [Pseudomonadota bacterium]